VTLGRFSLGAFMPGARIAAAHGTTRPVAPTTGAPDATAFALYHPAAAFRQASLRETLFHDVAGLPQVLLDARTRRGAPAAGPPRDEAAAAAYDGPPEDGATDMAALAADVSPATPAMAGADAPGMDQLRLF
jgi:hypothetical protein